MMFVTSETLVAATTSGCTSVDGRIISRRNLRKSLPSSFVTVQPKVRVEVEGLEGRQDLLQGTNTFTDSSRNGCDDDKPAERSGESETEVSTDGSVSEVASNEGGFGDTDPAPISDPAVDGISSKFDEKHIQEGVGAMTSYFNGIIAGKDVLENYVKHLIMENRRLERANKQAQSQLASLGVEHKITNDHLDATEGKVAALIDEVQGLRSQLAGVEDERDLLKTTFTGFEACVRLFGKDKAMP